MSVAGCRLAASICSRAVLARMCFFLVLRIVVGLGGRRVAAGVCARRRHRRVWGFHDRRTDMCVLRIDEHP